MRNIGRQMDGVIPVYAPKTWFAGGGVKTRAVIGDSIPDHTTSKRWKRRYLRVVAPDVSDVGLPASS